MRFREKKFSTLLLFWTLVLTSHFTTQAQIRTISSFNPNDPNRAFVLAIKSDEDSLLLDKHFQNWELKPQTLWSISNKTIFFEEGVRVSAKAGAFLEQTDALFKLVGCKNVSFIGSGNRLSMRKSEYAEGEWRHVIAIRGGEDLRFEDLVLEDSGGDGVFIDRHTSRSIPDRVFFENIVAKNNKRQGISIICGRNIVVKSSSFIGTTGTQPGAGVDLEPDRNTDVLENIVFQSCNFSSNYGPGIKLALHKLTSESKPIDIRFVDCLLEDNFSKENETVPAEIILLSNKLDPVRGQLLFEKCSIQNSSWGAIYSRKSGEGYNVRFDTFSATNIAQNPRALPIYLELPHYDRPCTLGGFEFNDFFVNTSNSNAIITIRGSRYQSLQTLKDFKGNITLTNRDSSYINYIHYDPKKNSNVALEFILKR